MSFDAKKSQTKTSKGHFVPSRYKQAAANFSGDKSSREKSSQDTTRHGGFTSSRIGDITKQSTMAWSDESAISKSGSSIQENTSTPGSQDRVLLPPLDASAITNASAFLSVPGTTHSTKLSVASRSTSQKNRRVPMHSVLGSQHTKGVPQSTTRQDEGEMEVYYAQYLQAKLLEAKSKKALEMRAKSAYEKMEKIYFYIRVLLEKKNVYERRINVTSYSLLLHHHLLKQEEMLKPVIDMLPTFVEQYEDIVRAVNTVSHKLEVKNLATEAIPEEEVVTLLQNICNCLKDIETAIPNTSEIVLSASKTSNLAAQGKIVAEEIKSASQLLSEAHELLLTEANLKLGEPFLTT